MLETLPNTLSRKSFLQMMMGSAAGLLAPVAAPPSLKAAVLPAAESATKATAGSLVRGLTPTIRLYGTTAALIGDNAKLEDGKSFVICKDSGRIKWNVTVPEDGDYDLFLSCAVPYAGFHIEVIAGAASVRQNLKVSEGIYRSSEEGWINAQGWINFEKIRLAEKLHLTRGINPVILQVSGPDKEQEIHFRSLELLAPAALAETAASEESARAARADTDWFVKAGYGVMFTWTDQTQPREGSKKSYSDAVNAFNVDSFASVVEDIGAGYVIFTVNHAHPHCPAPIRAWEEIHPGSTTQRDLIGEMADALQKRGIRFLLYIHSPVLTKLGDMLPTDCYDLTFSEEQFTEIHRNILSEMGSRYGTRLDGYWFDSWFQSFGAYPDVPLEAIYRFCKIGNPGRITTYNFWVFPVQNPWQDYWAGEIYALQNPFPSRYIQAGAGKGFQAHGVLSMMPSSWLHQEVGQIPPPQFSAADLIAYVKVNMDHQAVTTINIGIYQEGTLEQSSIDIMRQLRKAVRGS